MPDSSHTRAHSTITLHFPTILPPRSQNVTPAAPPHRIMSQLTSFPSKESPDANCC